ncbi:MAG: GNAT family protein [Bacteroidota bacterium]
MQLIKISTALLETYRYWQLPFHDYHQMNGPYFEKPTASEVNLEVQRISQALQFGEDDPLPLKRLVLDDSLNVLGELNWYWKSEETNWLEVGVIIYEEKNRGVGLGRKALTIWIDYLFETKPEIVRIGLTTWSGNLGMIKLAEKLGMIKEACYRKARVVNGKYYDSVSYGILKEEWFEYAT